MHHPDFTEGSDGKVDWTALANIVGGGHEKKNPKRDEIDWKIDDDLKTKRKRKTYTVTYRLDDTISKRTPGNKQTISLGSYYIDPDTNESQSGITNQNLAKKLIEKRRREGQCIKLETMKGVLAAEGYRLTVKYCSK